ncbi:hypothetical protein [Oceanicaulis sp.]|uniref:hypothetical protein n=1 Tax=Oceanicaulis sp. TaxID=1924941 RepID=UPI003D2A8CB1
MHQNPSDQDIFKLIHRFEDELEEQEVDPSKRSWEVPHLVMKALGYKNFILGVPSISDHLFERVRGIHQTFYRPKDIGVGGLHGGVFMFRGIATWIYIPIAYGTCAVNSLDLSDLSDNQKIWLQGRSKDFDSYNSTFHDLFDFAGAIGNLEGYERPPEASMSLLRLAAFHHQAAAATLCSAFDVRGCVQSSILATEIAMKASILSRIDNMDEIKNKYGHNLHKLLGKFMEYFPKANIDRMMDVIQSFPKFVENRYSQDQPTRREAGRIAMEAQFISGEVARALTGGSIKDSVVKKDLE